MNNQRETILYVSTSAQHYQGAGGRTRIINLIKYSRENNFNIILLCFLPLKQFFNLNILTNSKKILKKDSNSKVVYFPKIPTKIFMKSESYLGFYYSNIINKISNQYSIGIIHAHGHSAARMSLFAKEKNKKLKLITDSHGVSPEEVSYENPMVDTKYIQYITETESYVINNTDWNIFVSNAMKRHYSNKYAYKKSNYTVIPCATDLQPEPVLKDLRFLREEYGLKNRIVFCYVGSIRKYQLVKETLDVFIEIKKQFDSAYLMILSSHVENFNKLILEKSIPKKDFLVMSVSQKDVNKFTTIADFGFLLRDKSTVNVVSSPTKFAEYLMSGVPVITTNYVGDYSLLVDKKDIGLIIDIDKIDKTSLNKFINRIMKNRNKFRSMCYEECMTNLTWESNGIKIIDIYLNLSK